ncbi:hypothetical protein lerEdw1_007384 [Lerista edwardsae]|nr:hypothetical protein lerEdw1_007384 [Lerista edwardsae]
MGEKPSQRDCKPPAHEKGSRDSGAAGCHSTPNNGSVSPPVFQAALPRRPLEGANCEYRKWRGRDKLAAWKAPGGSD